MLGGCILIKKQIPSEGFSHPLVHSNILISAILLLIKNARDESQKQGYWRSLPLQFISRSNQTAEGFVNLQGKKHKLRPANLACLSGLNWPGYFMRCLAAWVFNFILLFYVLGAYTQRPLDNCLFFNKANKCPEEIYLYLNWHNKADTSEGSGMRDSSNLYERRKLACIWTAWSYYSGTGSLPGCS